MIFAQDVFTHIYAHTRTNTDSYTKEIFRFEYLIIITNVDNEWILILKSNYTDQD